MTTTTAVYEHEGLRRVAGDVLRPGGLALTAAAAERIGLRPGARVLDLGCGPGASLGLLAERFEARVLGLDSSANQLTEARSSGPKLSLVQGRADVLPLTDGSLDAVFCECVLSLCASPRRVLTEIFRALRPGGALVMSDLYARSDASVESMQPEPSGCLQQMRPLHRLLEDLRGAGFGETVLEDQTSALKRFAAELIFAHGSLERFWRAVLPPGAACATLTRASVCKPGYFQLIAKRPY